MLLIGGNYDKKYRQLPITYVLIYGVIASTFMIYRLIVAPDDIKLAITISSITTMGLVGGISVISYITKMIGSGDILVIVLSFVMSPYVPRIGVNTPPLPLLIPLSVIISTVIIYSRYFKETRRVETFPREYRRVVVKSAGELKNMKILSYYPVYILGKGYVYEKIFKSNDPMQESMKILSDTQDSDVVYAIPSYPFVFYYAIGFTLSVITLTFYNLIAICLGI